MGVLDWIVNKEKEKFANSKALVDAIVKPVAKTLVKPVIQMPRTTVSSLATLPGDIKSYVTGKPVEKSALYEQGEAWKRPVNVPGLGEVKGLSATPGDVQRYNTQTAGETAVQAVDLAATTMPFTGVGAFTNAGTKAAAKIVPKASPFVQSLVKRGVQGATDFATGGVSSAAADYMGGERDNTKLLKSFATGGAANVALPLALEGTVRGAQAVKSKVGGAISDSLQATEKRLAERVAAAEGAKLTPKTVDTRIAKIMGEVPEKKGYFAKLKDAATEVKKMAQSSDQTKLNAVRFLRDMKTYFVDSDAPILAQADKMRRMGLHDEATALENAVGDTRSARTAGEGRALENDNALRAITGGDPKLGRGVDDLLETNTRIDTAIRDGNQELADRLRKESDDVLAATHTPEEIAKVKEGAALAVQQNEAKLQRLVDEGIVTPEQAAKYKQDNPNYSKIFDLEHILAKTHGPSVGGGKDLAETGIKMREEAKLTAARATVDAREANAIDTILQEERIARNSRTRAMVDADAKAGTGNFTKVAEETPDTVTVFRNGQKEFYQPNDPQMARFFKGQEQDWGKVWGIPKALASFTREWATQINPLFSIKNYIRDQQSRLSNLDLPWTYGDMSTATKAASNLVNGIPDPIATRAMKLGGVMGSAGFKREAADETTELAKKLIQRKSATGVVSKVKNYAEISELSTRINIMLAAERAGITDPKVIRSMMREATLDFAAAGTFVREMNKGVPFFNAGIQGLRTTLKALAKDPAGYARRQQLLAVYPQILLDGHNKQFASNSKIANEDKRLNHIYILREEKDENGEPKPIYLKIPKGEGNRLFSNITALLENENVPWSDKAKRIVNEFASATPLQGEVFSTGGSTGLPIPIPGGSPVSAMVGVMFNKDWKGNDIVSPNLIGENPLLQRSKSTSNMVKDAADAIYENTGIRLSPQKTQYLLKTIGSGLGSQIFSATSKGYDAVTGQAGGQDTSALSSLANKPGFEAFLSDDAKSQPLEVSMANEKAKMALGDVKVDANRKRDEIIKSLSKIPQGPERSAFIEAGLKNKSFTAADVENVKKELVKKTYSQGIAPSDPQNLKGIKIFNGLKAIKTPEEKKAYLAKLLSDGAISKGSLDAYKAYRAHQLIGNIPGDQAKAKLKEMVAKGEITVDADFMKLYAEYRKMDQ